MFAICVHIGVLRCEYLILNGLFVLFSRSTFMVVVLETKLVLNLHCMEYSCFVLPFNSVMIASVLPCCEHPELSVCVGLICLYTCYWIVGDVYYMFLNDLRLVRLRFCSISIRFVCLFFICDWGLYVLGEYML